MSPETRKISWVEVQDAAKRVANALTVPEAGLFRVYGIPRGGIVPASLVAQLLEKQYGTRCILEEDPIIASVFVDDIFDSGNTKIRYNQKYPGTPFLPLFTKGPGVGWFSFPWERMNNESEGEDSVIRMLQAIDEDVNREGLLETPKRVVKSWETLFGGYGVAPESVFKVFTDGACDEMVVLRDIEFYSHCEHHIMPFFGRAHIGYLPDKKVLGISKLARLLEIFARRLQIQERLGQQVTEALMEYLEPQGVGCVLEAQHFCMTSRGVQKQNSIMVTSSMRGSFREEDVKNEFLRMIGK